MSARALPIVRVHKTVLRVILQWSLEHIRVWATNTSGYRVRSETFAKGSSRLECSLLTGLCTGKQAGQTHGQVGRSHAWVFGDCNCSGASKEVDWQITCMFWVEMML